MANFLQGDVLFGQNALTNTTSFINQISSVTIQNGVFQHVNTINQYDSTLGFEQPTEWQDDFIMNASFDEDTSAGSVGNLLGVANAILIKRREAGVYNNISDGWLTIGKVGISNADDLKFTLSDYMCKNNTTYEYVLIPTLIQIQGGIDVQIETSISSDSTILTVLSEFDKIYICTTDAAQSLYAGGAYDNMNTERLTGTHQALGNKYPIVVTNSKINYHTGGVNGIILNKYYGKNNPATNTITPLDRQGIIEARKEFDDFITQGIPMVLKDWNGNAWLIMITDIPSYTWASEWGMGLGTLSFSWTEIGSLDSQDDLDKAGMVYEREGGLSDE